MASTIGNVDLILNTEDKAPNCPHGPTLLFSKYDLPSGKEKRFYACAAFRDRKQCPFFQLEHEQVSSETLEARENDWKTKQPPFTHKQFRKRYHEFKKLKKSERNVCMNCGLLLLPGEIDEHEGQGHVIKGHVTKQLLRRPTELFAPLDNNKTYAQYLFSRTAVEFVIDTLQKLGFTNIVCVGCPRIHEAVLAKSSEEPSKTITSLLLDLDHRYLQMYSPEKFCRYNMFNHHFFTRRQSNEVFERFLSEEPGKRVAMVMDPPFGGMVEALAASVRSTEKTWQKLSGHNNEQRLPVFWFFPYFMERRIIDCCPTFTMLDYKVDYENHVLFTGEKGRKRGSPVRIFTNVSPAKVVLPADQGYWYCALCERYYSPDNQHCEACNSCTTKDGRTYRHCEKCDRCVKPSRVHCDSCNICDVPGHQCGKLKITGCHICGEMDHKRRECPKKNFSPSANKGTKRKKVQKNIRGKKERKKTDCLRNL